MTKASDHSFIIPSSAFNSASATPTEGQALPNYLLDHSHEPPAALLADFRAVLLGLAAPDHADNNRAHVFPVDLDTYIQSSYSASDEAMNTIKGKSKIGFDIVILAATNDKKEPVYLYVVDDKLRKRMIVAGPEDIPAALAADLQKKGVDYVVKDDTSAALQINEFLSEGAKERAHQGKLVQAETQTVIENLIRGFSALCDVSSIGVGVTLGGVIHSNNAKPAVFTSILRGPR